MSASAFDRPNRGFLGPRSEALAANELRVRLEVQPDSTLANKKQKARDELRLDIDGNGFNWRVWVYSYPCS